MKYFVVLILVLSLSLLCWSCASGSDDKRSNLDDDDDDDDDNDDDQDPNRPDPPIIDPIQNPYPFRMIALSGQAGPNMTLEIEGAQKPYVFLTPDDGLWCLSVELAVDPERVVENVLTLRVTDAMERTSDPAVVHIFVDITLNPDPTNVAPGSAPDASSSNENCDCDPQSAIDNSNNTFWSNSTSDVEGSYWERQPQWLRLDLGTNYYSLGAKIIWGSSCASDFSLYYTDDIDAPAPHISLDEYSLVEHVTGAGYCNQHLFQADEALGRQWVLVMYDGDQLNPATGRPIYQVKNFSVTGVPWDEYIPQPRCPEK